MYRLPKANVNGKTVLNKYDMFAGLLRRIFSFVSS